MSYLYYIAAVPIVCYLLRKLFNRPYTPLRGLETVKDRVVVITGASAGIGKETALELLRLGSIVVLAVRDLKKMEKVLSFLCEEARKRVHILPLDLSSFESIKAFEKRFSELRLKINILVNNAGCFQDTYRKTSDGIESTIHSNHFGPMYLTALLLRHLDQNEGRVINLSSDAHLWVKRIDLESLEKDLEFKNDALHNNIYHNYGYSKICNIFFTLSLSNYFEAKNRRIKACSVHPGAVRTEIMRPTKLWTFLVSLPFTIAMLIFFKDAFVGAQTTLHTCYLKYNELVNGGYYQACALSKTSDLAKNDEVRKRCMEYSKKVIESRIDVPEELVELVKF